MRRLDLQQVNAIMVADNLLAICDSYGHIQYISPRLARLMGHEPAGLEGSNAYDLIPDAAWDAVIGGHEALLAGNQDAITQRVQWLDRCLAITVHLLPGPGRGHLVVQVAEPKPRRDGKRPHRVALSDPAHRR